MSETIMGCIVAGAAVSIAIPGIFRHYIQESRRDRVLRGRCEQGAVLEKGAVQTQLKARRIS